MSASEVITRVHKEEQGSIFEICINRPDVHNCVNGQTAEALRQAWRTFREDDDLVVAVLYGAGKKSFCSGADLSALETLVDIYADQAEENHFSRQSAGPMGGSRIVQRKPVITVSQGYTYAGGLELFCHGHIRIAEPQAVFSVACRRWGVPLVDGGTVYLPRLIGWGGALPMILTGQRIRAKRAYELGLVWEVVPKGRGFERAMKTARQLLSMPRDAMLADLSSVIDGSHLSLQAALQLEAANTHPVARSDSMKDGVARFIKGERFWFR